MFPQLNMASAYGVGIEIVALEPGSRFWAFVSLTNRTTHEVSLVVP